MDPVLCTRGALAAAVAMAFAGAAFAGGPGINLPAPALQEGFSIHGLIDTGFQIHHANGTTSARMMPNGDETSAFHLRARENLHGGNYVRLKLSAPFKPDSGEFNNKNTSGDPILFNEAFVAVGGEWGELAAGRLANIFSGNGDFGLCPHINPSPMGTNFPNAGLTPIFSSGYYYNNSVIYNSPRVNGFHVAAMYSNGRDDDSVSRGKSDQFSALALTYIGESFKFAVIPTYIDSDSLKTATVTPNDEYGIALLGSYWPEPTMGLHFGYQFVRDGRALGGSYFNYFTPAAAGGPGIAKSERGVDTHTLSLGFSKRFGAQKISIVLMGNKVEYKGDSAVDGDREGWRVIPATIYRYYLSKRTHFWASASTSQSGGLYKKAREFEKDPTKAWDVGAGLVHHF